MLLTNYYKAPKNDIKQDNISLLSINRSADAAPLSMTSYDVKKICQGKFNE